VDRPVKSVPLVLTAKTVPRFEPPPVVAVPYRVLSDNTTPPDGSTPSLFVLGAMESSLGWTTAGRKNLACPDCDRMGTGRISGRQLIGGSTTATPSCAYHLPASVKPVADRPQSRSYEALAP
jgi:hypothetical protein